MSEPRPLDFVYAGRRIGGKVPLLDEIYPIEDGKLLPCLHFKAARQHRVLGGIYTGALFHDHQVAGLNTARYTGQQWGKEHPEQVIEWEAHDTKARLNARSKVLEADAKKTGLIDEALSELRVLYAAMRNRGDYEGMQALESAILESLRTAR